MIRDSAGAETMDDLHQLVWEIQSRESDLLKKQTAQLQIQSDEAQKAFWAGLAVDSALLLVVYLFVRGEIRKRNRSETELGQTKDILESVMDNMVDAVLVADTKGDFLLANPAAKHMMGIDKTSVPTLDSLASKTQIFETDKTTPMPMKDRPLFRALQGEEEAGMEMFWKGAQAPDGLFLYAVATPLRDHAGKMLGAVAVYSDITERKKREGLILQDNSRLQESVERLEQYNREISVISKLVESLQACLSVEEVAKTSVAIMSELFPDTVGGVFIINNSKTRVELAAGFGGKGLSRDQFLPEECWAMRRSQPHHVDSTHQNMLCQHFKDEVPSQYICVPLAAQGTQVGLFQLSALASGKLGKNQRKLAALMGEQVALAIANLQLKEALKNQSIRDALTNLFNRRYLEEAMEREMARAERSVSKLSVLMLDIDHFKQFNDKFGHEAGDRVLWEVGSLLNKFVRKSDIACRYGGEELVVLLPDTGLDDAKNIAEKIREEIKDLTLTHMNSSLGVVTVSIGVSFYPEDGQTGLELMRQADIALYNAKSLGRDRVVCWKDVSSEGKKALPRLGKPFKSASPTDFQTRN